MSGPATGLFGQCSNLDGTSMTTTLHRRATYQGTTALVTSIGALVIEIFTTLAAGFLILPLYRQGVRRLRTKLLLGMVISDLALGITGVIPTAIYLAGKPMKAGTKSCDALGFVLTTVLFTQHLWTLVIAVATFALLKHPMSRFTHLLHTHWYIIPVLIWGSSLLHSAGWYLAFGFIPTSGGSLCYYGPGRSVLDRNLVQFIPRAFVFVVVIYLYSRLFRFLRRPDTISVSGSAKDTEDMIRARQQHRAARQPSTFFKFKRRARNIFGLTPLKAGSQAEHAVDVPPWELLHLSMAGINMEAIPATDVLPIDEKSHPALDDMSTAGDMARIERIRTASTFVSSLVSSSTGRNNSHDSQPKPPAPIDEKSEDSINVPILLINDERPPSSMGELEEPPSPLQLDENVSATAIPIPELQSGMAIKNKSSVAFDTGECAKEGAAAEPEPVMQTMRDFFQAHRATDTEVMHAHKGADIGPEESAAEYSNRQASLLMLYFPIAYLFVFSVSLVRLMHDMITSKPSSALTIISLWFVLSAGLLDALVYGVAELVIRRRVRRNLPDRN